MGHSLKLSGTSSIPGPRKGTLRVFPFVKDATSYIMLRPFMPDVPKNLFPGAIPGKAFHISAKWHPLVHGKLISVPEVKPGDTVWWHPDLVSKLNIRNPI